MLIEKPNKTPGFILQDHETIKKERKQSKAKTVGCHVKRIFKKAKFDQASR